MCGVQRRRSARFAGVLDRLAAIQARPSVPSDRCELGADLPGVQRGSEESGDCFGSESPRRRKLEGRPRGEPSRAPPIPDLKGAGLDDETLLQVDIGALSLGDLDDGGDRTPQVRQGVPFDGPLALAKLGPEKLAQAPVAGCRVEGRDRRLQLQTELLVGLQASGFHHELLRPVGVDAPVSAFVSLGQRAAGHLRPKPQGIEPLASGAQAGLDLAQAFPGRQRREGQGQKLAAAREAAPPAVFCSGSTRRWNGSRSRPSVRWAKTVRLGLMPRDGTLPLSVWNKTTTLPNAPHPFQAAPYGNQVTYRRTLQSQPDRSEIC